MSSGVCEQQRPRQACASAYWKVSYLDNFNFLSSLYTVAVGTGLSLALSETPKTGLFASRPKCMLTHTTFTKSILGLPGKEGLPGLNGTDGPHGAVGLPGLPGMKGDQGRVKSGNFGHQVNSDILLQTVKIPMRRLLMSRLIRIFIVCSCILFFITKIEYETNKITVRI